ncbi:MAG: hypothetical protein SFV51_15185 [Bryobacteraceae bacterium]|nr:hypothetical protein [Bryobacteraceae bacterium]
MNGAGLWTPPPTRPEARPPESMVGPVALWRGSVMAHSGRDPYWKAKLRFELAETPAAADLVNSACRRCHMPAPSTAEEGVTCTVCHQMMPDNLGTRDSFTGGFKLNEERTIYGPHADPFAMPMANFSGYTPTQGRHILDSAICGTCHTVITPTLAADGSAAGEFIEQGTYLEWLRSSYPAEGKTCQSCHMEVLKDDQGDLVAQYIAHSPSGGRFGPTRPRAPFGLHFFQGANVQILGMLQELFPEETDELELAAQRTRESLESAVALEAEAKLSGGTLRADISVMNRTGHKLPTAYPSRRMWLRVVVRDRDGGVVFESGAVDSNGEIRGVGESGGAIEPHHRLITRPDQIAIYEGEMRDPQGGHTVTLLRGAGFVKDNRILPAGYDARRPLPQGVDQQGLAPVGVEADSDFLPGSDGIRYEIATGAAPGPYRMSVEVLYQSIKPSHLAGMSSSRSVEEAEFLNLYPRHTAPALMSRREMVVTQ